MKNFFFIFCIAFFLLACNSHGDFTDRAGGFSIAFPSDPSISVDSFETELGMVVMHSFLVETSESNARMLTYSDYPISKVYLKDPYGFINKAKEGALRSLEIDKIISDKKFEEAGIPGVEVIGQSSQGLFMHYKLFLKDNRLYQIGLLKEGEMEETPEELEFIESFVLL